MEVFSSPKSLVLIRQVKCTLSEKFFSEEQTQSDKSVCNLLPLPSAAGYTMKSRKHFQTGKHQWIVLVRFTRASLFRCRLFCELPSDSVHFVDTRRNSKQLPAEVFRKPPWGESGVPKHPLVGYLSRPLEKAPKNSAPARTLPMTSEILP